jgi:hypothetical protein
MEQSIYSSRNEVLGENQKRRNNDQKMRENLQMNTVLLQIQKAHFTHLFR